MHAEKIRIYPDKAQIILIDNIIEECRCYYNWLLQCHWDMYDTCKIGPSRYDYGELYKVYPGSKKYMPGRARQNVEARLSDAFERWFNPNLDNKKPKFKSMKDYQSFSVSQFGHGFNIREKHIHVNKIGGIPANFSRPICGNPKRCIIKKTRSNKYYAFIIVDDSKVPKKNIPNRIESVGIDLGMKTFAQLSDGQFIKTPSFVNKREQKLVSKAHRNMSRKQYGSKNYEKARIRYAKREEHFANRRRDHHFKVSHWLTHNYKIIVCEDLTTVNMFRNKYQKNQRRVLRDLSFSIFLKIFEHMCDKYSSTLIKVDPRNTTQLCCVCGTTVSKTLDDREHICPVCGLTTDRDLNAALNILHRGIGGRSTTGTVGSIMLVEVKVPGL